MLRVKIADGSGNGGEAKVNSEGGLAVSPPSFNLIAAKELAEANTAYNFYSPRSLKQFIVTHIFAYGDKEVAGNTNASVVVYEAGDTGTITVDRIIMQFEIGQNEFQPFSLLNLLVNKGVFINAKTNDDDVHMNILGYYIDDTGEEV